jgi:hypothetical protein
MADNFNRPTGTVRKVQCDYVLLRAAYCQSQFGKLFELVNIMTVSTRAIPHERYCRACYRPIRPRGQDRHVQISRRTNGASSAPFTIPQ